ncbi:hypothetical protein [Natrialba asiatica]|uniref:Uncharacterized protein n=1 Tax=Natrialba asiatica (strain ATCC 700177 / DSM 12278 / JCM 9576 / FERM P-10747 / NBRC 102637 / 172P1) TaxID=29540 RepID=M0AXY6_NATA1|nr:hypothetical protein [Natrialba asiatica]ELZ03526.1 hypothetical protein C481_05155 [Natrialba asiatica DSM 12278]
MGTRTDATLAVLVLAAVGLAFASVGASVSLRSAAGGGCGTIAFEFIAARDPALVREYWERPAVQVTAVGLALLVIVSGATVAPSRVLSALAGALVTYLGFLGLTLAERRRSSR